MIKILKIQTLKKKEIIDLTDRVNVGLSKNIKNSGVCTLLITHTTACLTTGEVGEGTDEDLLEIMETFIPKISFRHIHNPSHAWTHMVSSITGTSLSLPFEDKKLILGKWQSVLLVELDGPRERTVIIAINE